MKTINRIAGVCLLILFTFIYCTKDTPDSEDPQQLLPKVSTGSVSSITCSAAALGGIVSTEGRTPILCKGVCWNTTGSPTVLDNKTAESKETGHFISVLSGLNPSTTYYARTYATNGAGTSYGIEVAFTTNPLPFITLETTGIRSVTPNSVILSSQIIPYYGATVYERGICWNTAGLPTISDNKKSEGSGAGIFQSTLSGLTPATNYYARTYALQSTGIAYSPQVIFNTYAGTVKDIDGNIYNTVKIGTQEWMVENLKTTRYRNGNEIAFDPDFNKWFALGSGAWHDSPYVDNFIADYGLYYNWYAVADSRKLCPTGWHVATEDEWSVLTGYLGGPAIAGAKLKETGNKYWYDPNFGATNESGFSARGAGNYLDNDSLWGWNVGEFGMWWTTKENDENYAYTKKMNAFNIVVTTESTEKKAGCSVRCIRD